MLQGKKKVIMTIVNSFDSNAWTVDCIKRLQNKCNQL